MTGGCRNRTKATINTYLKVESDVLRADRNKSSRDPLATLIVSAPSTNKVNNCCGYQSNPVREEKKLCVSSAKIKKVRWLVSEGMCGKRSSSATATLYKRCIVLV